LHKSLTLSSFVAGKRARFYKVVPAALLIKLRS